MTQIKTHLLIGKTKTQQFIGVTKTNEINWASSHCLVVSNGVVSVPLEGALVAGVGSVFNFVSVTSVGVAAAAAATTVASVVMVVGSPSITTVSLLQSV